MKNEKIPIRKVEIKIAAKEDAKILAQIGKKTFYDTYADSHTSEDIDAYLMETFNKEKVLCDIEDKNIMFLIASVNRKAIGYAKLTSTLTGTSNKKPNGLEGLKPVELERLYVEKEMVGKKIGTALMTKALEIVRAKNYKVIWLAVWEFNPKAIAFYERFGFKPFGSDIFTLGTTKRNLILMKKELS